MFGKPKQLKNLDYEVTAARIALSMYDTLPSEGKERVVAVAPREIRDAAVAAARAGHADAARQFLVDARTKPPSSSVSDQWAPAIDEALAALGDAVTPAN